MSSLQRRAIKGSVWTIINYGSRTLIRFGSNLVLTRLLEPELFGIMALVTSVRVGLELLSDTGTGQSLIQHPEANTPDFYNTVWTIQVFRGLALWGVALLITEPVAQFYNEDRLRWLFPAVSFMLVLDGCRSVSEKLLTRELKSLGFLTLYRTVIQLIALGVMIIWAWISPGVLALAVGTLVAGILGLLGSFVVLPNPHHKLHWDKAIVRELSSFGRWIFLSSLLFFLAQQIDRLIIGKILSFEILGIYVIAYTLASLPRQVVQALSNQVIFPAISRKLTLSRQELQAKITNQRSSLLMLSATGISFLAIFGDLLVNVLYDERYIDAGWMLAILCIGSWFSLFFTIGKGILMGLGKPMYDAAGSALQLATLCIGIPIGYTLFGMAGIVIAVALGDILSFFVIAVPLNIGGFSFWKQDLQLNFLFAGCLFIFVSIRLALGIELPFSPELLAK